MFLPHGDLHPSNGGVMILKRIVQSSSNQGSLSKLATPFGIRGCTRWLQHCCQSGRLAFERRFLKNAETLAALILKERYYTRNLYLSWDSGDASSSMDAEK
jgi:hypothetical protein